VSLFHEYRVPKGMIHRIKEATEKLCSFTDCIEDEARLKRKRVHSMK
jgi:hypothetical protein